WAVGEDGGVGEVRQGRPGLRGKLVQVESRMSLSGASADEWIPVKPGTEGVLALGIARVLAVNGGKGDANSLAPYEPAAVEKITGVPAKRVERLAHQPPEPPAAGPEHGGAPPAPTQRPFPPRSLHAPNAAPRRVHHARAA